MNLQVHHLVILEVIPQEVEVVQVEAKVVEALTLPLLALHLPTQVLQAQIKDPKRFNISRNKKA